MRSARGNWLELPLRTVIQSDAKKMCKTAHIVFGVLTYKILGEDWKVLRGGREVRYFCRTLIIGRFLLPVLRLSGINGVVRIFSAVTAVCSSLKCISTDA